MSKDTLRAYCATTLDGAMATDYPLIPVKWENMEFAQPKTTWLETGIFETANPRHASTGTRTRFHRHFEMIAVTVNVPENKGVKTGNDLAEYVKNLFEDKNVLLSDNNAVSFKVGKVSPNGLTNGFYQIVVTIPLWRDTPKPALS